MKRGRGKPFPKGNIPWNKNVKGIHLSPLSEFKKGQKGPWLGKKRPDLKNTNAVKTMFKKGQTAGSKNFKWKGGITPEIRKIRNSIEYKEWRMEVFQRDRFSCVNCGYRSKFKRDIRADHIKPFILFPKLRFDVDNGRTLCIPCDKNIAWNYFLYMKRQKEGYALG